MIFKSGFTLIYFDMELIEAKKGQEAFAINENSILSILSPPHKNFPVLSFDFLTKV